MTHEIRGVDIEKYALLCQQTSPKRWFGNVEMTSNCDVTSSANQIQMTTIWSLPKTPHENFLRTPLDTSHRVVGRERKPILSFNNHILQKRNKNDSFVELLRTRCFMIFSTYMVPSSLRLGSLISTSNWSAMWNSKVVIVMAKWLWQFSSPWLIGE